MPTNPYSLQPIQLASMARDVNTITPSDSVFFDIIPIAIRISTAGNLHVITAKDSERTITVSAGEILPVGLKKIYATGTTATGFLAYYL